MFLWFICCNIFYIKFIATANCLSDVIAGFSPIIQTCLNGCFRSVGEKTCVKKKRFFVEQRKCVLDKSLRN